MYQINKNIDFDIINIEQKNIHVSLINYGATIKQIQTPNHHGVFEDVLMEYLNDHDYINNSIYLNGTIGPIAGRVKEGKVQTNQGSYLLSKNQDNLHTLHSGDLALTYKLFSYEIEDNNEETTVIMTYKETSLNTFNYTVNVIYTITNGQLQIDYHIESNKSFPFSLTNHAYFNLSGNMKNDIKQHMVKLLTNQRHVLDDDQISTNKLVNDPLYDFTSATELNSRLLALKDHPYQGYDDIFSYDKVNDLTLMAQVYEPVSHRELKVYSTYNHLVFYTHNNINQLPLKHLGKHPMHYGLCFECEKAPIGFEKNEDNKTEKPYKETIIFKFGLTNL